MRLELSESELDAIAERVARRLAARQRPEETSPWLTVAEAAERLRAKPQRVYDLLSAGALTRHRDGGRVLVSRAELDEYVSGSRR